MTGDLETDACAFDPLREHHPHFFDGRNVSAIIRKKPLEEIIDTHTLDAETIAVLREGYYSISSEFFVPAYNLNGIPDSIGWFDLEEEQVLVGEALAKKGMTRDRLKYYVDQTKYFSPAAFRSFHRFLRGIRFDDTVDDGNALVSFLVGIREYSQIPDRLFHRSNASARLALEILW